MATKDYYTSSTSTGSSRMRSIYRMSDAQPDWAETDPSQPDYIKNKELAERFRPVSVNGEEVLDDSYGSGNLNLVGGDNVDISVENGSIKISAKIPEIPDVPSIQDTDTVRPIYVNGEEILSETAESGELNLVGGKNVTLAVEGNTVVISASSGGGSPESGDCDCPEYIEGEGIDITENIYGQREISIETGAISNDMISSVSIDKITNTDGIKLILNGGNANG